MPLDNNALKKKQASLELELHGATPDPITDNALVPSKIKNAWESLHVDWHRVLGVRNVIER